MLKKIRWKKHLLSIALFMLIFLLIRTYQLNDYATGPAPAFSATSIEGNIVNQSLLDNRPVLIYFWATWCPICKYHKQTIEDLSQDYRVITVASWSEDINEVRNYFSDTELRKMTLYDPDGVLAKRYGISAVPSFFILDEKGDIRFIERGFTSSMGLRLRLFITKYL
ncbi:MAG: protein disulfide oxidoreductase [Gammaproteobacteria bacterium]|nr:protein disulfide oxidoreductase [Gammaproteobacteria bacterium]